MSEDAAQRVLDLPMIVAGREVFAEADAAQTLDYTSGLQIRMPALTSDQLEAVLDSKQEVGRRLQRLDTDEITWFLGAVSDVWLSRTSPSRKIADEHAGLITGYPAAMVMEDYSTVGYFMNQRFHSTDQIAAEFGDARIFDEWVNRDMSKVRAYPRGLAVHYLVGNLPLAAMYSLLRGILTRNVTFAKLPGRDPLSALALARTMIEVDPDHPVTQSLSLCYWPQGDEMGNRVLRAADAACVWGGEAAVNHVRHHVPVDAPVAAFGPKWSLAAVDLDGIDPIEAADRLAEDVCFYDQEACFSTQRVFVRGDAVAFAETLAGSLERFAGRYPLGFQQPDALAHRSATLLECEFLGLGTLRGDDWSIIIAGDDRPFVHPLTRTVLLEPITDWGELAQHLDSRTQTLSVFPPSLGEQWRNDWAAAGADRIADLGWARLPRSGWTHDGGYGMHPLVRLVTADRPRVQYGPHYPRPASLEGWQREYFAGRDWHAPLWFQLAGSPSGMAS